MVSHTLSGFMRKNAKFATMRRFLTFLLCLFAALLLTGGCDKTNGEPGPPVLMDGEWTGTGEGRGGTILVRITVLNHVITDIVVVSQSESSFAQESIREMVARALQKQALLESTDAVSGATLTSNGVIDAINMAIQAALGQQADRKTAYKDGSCDIVIIGGGGAGLSAAVEAATDKNLHIILLEKQGILGGNTNYSTGGINAAETPFQDALGIKDSKDLFYNDTMTGGGNENDPALVRSLVDNAPATLDWLSGLGADLTDVGLMGGSSAPRTHRPKGGTAIGAHLMKILKEAAATDNIEIRTSNKATGLLSVGGTVTGVSVENADGSTYRISAKAVVIATGGFGANLDMVTRYQPGLAGFATLNHPGATGDAFQWLAPLGAGTVHMPYIQIHPTAEADSHILITEAVRGNGAILVNSDARRFVNEMDTRDVVSAAILAQGGKEAWLVFDDGVRKSLSSIETYANQHLLTQGNTPSELASRCSLPGDALTATLARYAQFQQDGKDEDFGRSAVQMTSPLLTPPYYAVRVRPAIHHTMGGIRVNADMQVLRTDDSAIPGLFAAGEVTGGIHGKNRLGGNGVADIVVNGKIAGKGAALRAKGQ